MTTVIASIVELSSTEYTPRLRFAPKSVKRFSPTGIGVYQASWNSGPRMLHAIWMKSSEEIKYTSNDFQRVGSETHLYGENSGNKVQASEYAKRFVYVFITRKLEILNFNISGDWWVCQFLMYIYSMSSTIASFVIFEHLIPKTSEFDDLYFWVLRSMGWNLDNRGQSTENDHRRIYSLGSFWA